MKMRSLICGLLALMLALTSQSMAVARGSSAATGQMVLCTGTGPVAIYVDAQGQPTAAPHICPDSALNVLFDVPPLDLAAMDNWVSFSHVRWAAAPVADLGALYGPPATGPPVGL